MYNDLKQLMGCNDDVWRRSAGELRDEMMRISTVDEQMCRPSQSVHARSSYPVDRLGTRSSCCTQCIWNALPSPAPEPVLCSAAMASELKEILRASVPRGSGAMGLDRRRVFGDTEGICVRVYGLEGTAMYGVEGGDTAAL